MTGRKFSKLRKLLVEIETTILSCSEKSCEKFKFNKFTGWSRSYDSEVLQKRNEKARLNLHLLNYLFKATWPGPLLVFNQYAILL